MEETPVQTDSTQQPSPPETPQINQQAPETPQELSKQSLFVKLRDKKKIMFAVLSIIILGLVGGGIVYIQRMTSKKTAIELTGQENAIATALSQREMPQFAEYHIEKVNVAPSLKSYSLETSEIANLQEIEVDRGQTFTPQQLQVLEQQGFFLESTKGNLRDPEETVGPEFRVDDMVDLYRKFGGDRSKYFREPKDTIFVTTDALLHIYHIFIDKLFQNLEETKFHPMLKSLSHSLLEDSLKLYQTADSAEEKESLKRVTAYFLVPSILLDASIPKTQSFSPQQQEEYLSQDEAADTQAAVLEKLENYREQVPDEIFDLARKELVLLMDAREVVTSPVFGELRSEAGLAALEDYTQYKPRSHYNKNSILRSYFRAMMWFGRQSFVVRSRELTQDAITITWLVNNAQVEDRKAIEVWEDIYLPTVFFVGRSDDLSFYEYTNLLSDVFGQNVTSEELMNKEKIQKFHEEAQKMPGPKILSEVIFGEQVFEKTKEELLAGTQSFRFMGQRFIPDSYMFSRLTQGAEKPDPDTGQKLPSTPTALMIMTILGSDKADAFLNDWITSNAPTSDKVIAKVKGQLKTEFGKLTEEDWTVNIYWGWLYSIKSLFTDFGEGYPMFMKGESWLRKGLNTALGSWTELRHDTLLYAKQSYAELGGGGEPPPLPPVPKGYVEPNIIFFERLIALAKMTDEGLKAEGLLEGEFEQRLQRYIESLEFLQGIAVKQLQGNDIPEDEYERLRTIGSELAPVVYPLEGDLMREKDARAGIIADVHTDALKNQILYEATGTPMVIYVAVKDNGGTRLTRGTTYSYYEFVAPLGDRLTDEQWQDRVYQEKAELPARPGWVGDLLK